MYMTDSHIDLLLYDALIITDGCCCCTMCAIWSWLQTKYEHCRQSSSTFVECTTWTCWWNCKLISLYLYPCIVEHMRNVHAKCKSWNMVIYIHTIIYAAFILFIIHEFVDVPCCIVFFYCPLVSLFTPCLCWYNLRSLLNCLGDTLPRKEWS